MVQRIAFYYGMSRNNVLDELSLDEVFSHNKNALYFFLESQGKPVKKLSNEQKRAFETDRKEMLKKIYGED